MILFRIQPKVLIFNSTDCEPMSLAYLADLMNKTWCSLRINVYQVSNNIRIIFSSNYHQRSLPRVEPCRTVPLPIERCHEHVDIEISSEKVLMRVDEGIRKLVANVVKVSFVVYFTSEKVIDTIEAALEGEIRLFFEIYRFLLLHKTNIEIAEQSNIIRLLSRL